MKMQAAHVVLTNVRTLELLTIFDRSRAFTHIFFLVFTPLRYITRDVWPGLCYVKILTVYETVCSDQGWPEVKPCKGHQNIPFFLPFFFF